MMASFCSPLNCRRGLRLRSPMALPSVLRPLAGRGKSVTRRSRPKDQFPLNHYTQSQSVSSSDGKQNLTILRQRPVLVADDELQRVANLADVRHAVRSIRREEPTAALDVIV